MFEWGVSELPTPPVLPASAPVPSLITDRNGTARVMERPQWPTQMCPLSKAVCEIKWATFSFPQATPYGIKNRSQLQVPRLPCLWGRHRRTLMFPSPLKPKCLFLSTSPYCYQDRSTEETVTARCCKGIHGDAFLLLLNPWGCMALRGGQRKEHWIGIRKAQVQSSELLLTRGRNWESEFFSFWASAPSSVNYLHY